MDELLPCPFCGGKAFVSVRLPYFGETFTVAVVCEDCNASSKHKTKEEDAIKAWNTRTPKERGADKPKITCLNCKHLVFSDMYGECNKQLRIVNPNDTCECAEPKERGGEK